MRQILQNLGSGETMLAEVPAPLVRDGSVLIRTSCSLVSVGTERMLIEFGEAGVGAESAKLDDVLKGGIVPR